MYTNKSTVILSTQNIQSPFCTCTEGTGVFLIDDHEVLLLSQRCAVHYRGLESLALSLSVFFIHKSHDQQNSSS